MSFISFNLWPAGIWYKLPPAILILLLVACALPGSPGELPAQPVPGQGTTQTGIASWYGPGFHGQRTASGAVYNQYELTAAHRTLPLGSRVAVTNLQNGRSVEVSINDRGPFVEGRIIDLSYATARALGMVGPGTIRVRIELIDSGLSKIRTIRSNLDYTLQVGSFVDIDNARELKNRLTQSYSWGSQLSIVPFQGKDGFYYRVQLGTFSDRREAKAQAEDLAREGLSIIIMEK